MRTLLFVVVAVLAATRIARAYPQYQLSRDATCTGCHLSPSGGGLLDENGLAVADSTAWKPGDPEFLHGVIDPPGWLTLGGDVRGAAGLVDSGVFSPAGYPMQGEVYASAGTHGFTVNATGGLRQPQDGGNALHVLWSREHYVMYQHEAVFVRAGRFMPVFGLRLAEHIAYTQRYGGQPLYGEAYGLAAEYVTRPFEIHATGFIHDGIASAVEHGDGAALYAEARLGEHAAVGVEGKYSSSDDQHLTYGGVTGKVHLPGPDILLQGDGEEIRRKIVAGAGDISIQLAGYLLATHPLPSGLLLDVGVGHYTQDTRTAGLYRDCVDANLHWFQTSHLEWLVTTRLELLNKGSGTNGGYALLQLHYRL